MGSSYKPFRLWEDEKDAVYIVRLAPLKTGVEMQLLSDSKQFEVCIYQDDTLVKSVTATEKFVTVDGLAEDAEYSLIVKSENGESRKRLFRTGDYLGTVVNYLHPKDEYYAFSGRYIASPHIIRFKGDLYVSMDVFRGGDQRGAFNLTLLYRSKDNGKNWEYVTDIVPSFWGTLFVANGKLGIAAADTEAGSLVVMSSEDGENWSDPTYLLYGCGSTVGCGFHSTPTPYIEKDGKLYFGFEYGGHGVKRFDTFIACFDMSKDICDKSAWTISGKRRVEFEWDPNSDCSIRFAIESNIVERDGEIFSISRFAYRRALMLKYDDKNPEKAPEFYKVVDFLPGHCKFYIQKADNGIYYALGNNGCYPRHKIECCASKDLENWVHLKTFEDISDRSVEQDGVQYPSFIIENGKFVTVLRNALNGAHTFHDSNAIVFKTYDIPEWKE